MLPESIPASQNILTFQQLQVYVILPECTPPSQNIPLCQHVTFSESTLPSLIYPPFPTIICVAPRIYPPPPLAESPNHFLPLYATLPESTPASQNILSFQQLYVMFPESITPSQNIPLFKHVQVPLPESTPPTHIIPPPLPLFPYLPLPSRITHPLFYHYMRNQPLPPRINPLFHYYKQHS